MSAAPAVAASPPDLGPGQPSLRVEPLSKRFEGYNVIVTGGASGKSDCGNAMSLCCSNQLELTRIPAFVVAGIGLATVVEFLREAASAVAIFDINDTNGRLVEPYFQAQGFNVRFYPVDVSSKEACVEAVNAFAAANGGVVHTLFNNAACFLAKGLDATAADWNKVLSVNVQGYANMVQVVQPLMQRGRDKRCSIVNNSSISASRAQAAHWTYSASKGAIKTMTRVSSANCRLSVALLAARVRLSLFFALSLLAVHGTRPGSARCSSQFDLARLDLEPRSAQGGGRRRKRKVGSDLGKISRQLQDANHRQRRAASERLLAAPLADSIFLASPMSDADAGSMWRAVGSCSCRAVSRVDRRIVHHWHRSARRRWLCADERRTNGRRKQLRWSKRTGLKLQALEIAQGSHAIRIEIQFIFTNSVVATRTPRHGQLWRGV